METTHHNTYECIIIGAGFAGLSIASSLQNQNITDNTFVVDNHFFTTGEKLTYTPTGTGTTMSIGIAATTVVGTFIRTSSAWLGPDKTQIFLSE